jgi:integrase
MRGHIHKRVRRNAAGKDMVRWYVVVDVGVNSDGRRKQKWHGGFDTRREAEVERAKIVSDLHSGGYVAPDRLKLAEWVRQGWLPMTRTRVKPSTFDSYRANMETHVLPVLGTRALQQLTAPMLNTLYAELLSHGGERGPLAAKTVCYIHTIVHKALADAVDAGIIGANVAERAKPPRPNRGRAQRIECWEPAELAAFLESVRDTRLEVAWRLAAMTGMRRGEVLGLRWRDVDFDGSCIAVRNAIVSVAYEVLESSPKSHQARVIDLDPGTMALLWRHRERQLGGTRGVWGRVRRSRSRDLRRERKSAPPAELQPGIRQGS